jgi:hypothetical protein
MKLYSNKIKVIHLPTDLGMRAYSLCRAEREFGLESYVIVKRPGVHNSEWVTPLHSNNPFVYLWNLMKTSANSIKSDVIMANSGSSLLDFPGQHLDLIDIPLYRSMGKRLIVTYQGCDIRICENCPVRNSLPTNVICINVPSKLDYKNFDRRKFERLKIWSRYADAILGITPDLCLVDGVIYTPHAKFLDGLPEEINKTVGNSESKIRIAHMPKIHIKGTDIIEAKIGCLKQNHPDRI